jgi:hypothetical protein
MNCFLGQGRRDDGFHPVYDLPSGEREALYRAEGDGGARQQVSQPPHGQRRQQGGQSGGGRVQRGQELHTGKEKGFEKFV